MPKKENNYYLEVNALFVVLVAYCYYKMNEDEQYNDAYNYPIKTSINWTPIALSSLMLLLSSTTTLILALNPGRNNFHESNAQKYLEVSFKMAEGMLPLATKYGFKIAEVIGGDRVEALQDVTDKGLTYVEQGFRFLVTGELIHAHQTARSFVIPANAATNTEEERYLSKIAYITHNIDKAFILSVESVASFIWNSGLYKVLNQYLHIDDKDTVSSLNALYLLADLIKFIGTKTINNLSLATEIVIYGEDKSKYYKIEELELILAIKSFANEILTGIKRAEQEAVDIKNQLEAKILEAVNFKLLSEATEKTKEEIAIQLTKAQETLEELKKELEEKAQEIGVRISEGVHLKEMLNASENELAKLNHYFGNQIEKLEKCAKTLQAHWHGIKARKMPEIKVFIEKKMLRILNEKPIDQSSSTVITTADEHKSDAKDAEVSSKIIHDKSNEIIVSLPKAEEHHSFFEDLLHSHNDKKQHSGFLNNLFSGHSSSSRTDSQSNPSKASGGKVVKASSGSNTHGEGAVQPKNEHANLNEKAIDSSGSYISLITQKISEFLFTLSSTTIKAKIAAPKNEQQEEYKKAKQEAEKYINNKVTINYEDSSMFEKPLNQTQMTSQKIDEETMDMMLLLENAGVSISMFGEEGGVYNQNAVMVM